MVRNALTWQNVAAPDFSTALDGMQGAGQAWARGFEGLSGALGDWRTRQKEQASAEAMGQALGINSSGGWDQAMAGGGGFGALGINARDATPELLDFMNGRRGDLLGNESTAAGTAQTQVDMNNAIADQNFENKQNVRTELDWGREDETRIQAEETRLHNENLKRAAFDFMKLHGNNTELAINAARQSGQFGIEDQQAIFGIISGTSPELTGVTSGSLEAAEFSEAGMLGDRVLSEKTAASVFKRNQNPGLALYEKAITGGYSGDTDAAARLQEEILGTSEEGRWANNPEYGATSGKIVEYFNKLKGEYKHAPDSVIATVLKNSTGTDGWIFTGKPDTDLTAARLALEPFKNEAAVTSMGQEYRQWAQEDKEGKLLQSQFDKSKKAYAAALDTGDQAKADAAEKKMWAVLERYGIEPGSDEAKAATQPNANIGSIVQSGLDRASASTPEKQAQIAADEAAGVDPSIRAFNDGVARVLPTESKAEDFGKAGEGILQAMNDGAGWVLGRAGNVGNAARALGNFGVGMVDPVAGSEGLARTKALGREANSIAENGLFGTAPPAATPAPTAAPVLPVEQIAQVGAGQFANEPASVVSDMISSTLDLSKEASKALKDNMDALDSGSLSESDAKKSRNTLATIIEGNLNEYVRSGQPIPTELSALLADIQSRYLPLNN